MIVEGKIPREELVAPFVKAVADIARKRVALGCALHSDCADELMADDSLPADLWGFNIYPDGSLDFISLLNIRPAAGNRLMDIQDEKIRKEIQELVSALL
jgi:hypothetical protein